MGRPVALSSRSTWPWAGSVSPWWLRIDNLWRRLIVSQHPGRSRASTLGGTNSLGDGVAGLSAQIPLRDGRGTIVGYAVVDEGDAARIGAANWRLVKGKSDTTPYAIRWTRVGGRRCTVRMHREVLGLPRFADARRVDHLNHNGLDNRSANLRVVDNAQNQQNRLPLLGSSSRHRGVSWVSKRGKWRAGAKLNGRSTVIGYFDCEDQAAVAASRWRAEYMPFSVERIAA